MNDHLLITGFTAFEGFPSNPGEAIARRVAADLGGRFEPLEVAYDAVEVFVDRLRAGPPARWVMVGVAGGAGAVRGERVARNWVGPGRDVRGAVRGPGPISPGLPASLPGTWFGDVAEPPRCCEWSGDAGDYLCNYVYWLAVTRLPSTRSAFVHVAPPGRLPEQVQVRAVLDLLGGHSSGSQSNVAGSTEPRP